MTSRYIQDAVERCKLPIRVSHDGENFEIRSHCYVWYPVSTRRANLRYALLCAELQPEPFEDPAMPPLAGPAAPIAESRSAPGAVE